MIEFIVSTKDRPQPYKIEFEKIFPLKPQIKSAVLLFNFNSYLVNVKEKFFVINGGRKISIKGFESCSDLKVTVVKRHRRELSLGKAESNGKGKEYVFFLLGWEGTVEGEKKELFLNISPEGNQWFWASKR